MAKQDTKKTGSEAKPRTQKAKTEVVKLDHAKRYTLKATGTRPGTEKGQILGNVGGASAECMINGGHANLVE